MTGVFEVSSVEETWALARKFANTLSAGDVVCLEGDLGAGKTTFTQGLAAALGAKGRVASPTFCIVREHPIVCERNNPDAPRLLVHIDLYRLHGEEDVEALGWDDYLAKGAVMVVEWPVRAGSLIPKNAKRVVFSYLEDNDGNEEKRKITIDETRANNV